MTETLTNARCIPLNLPDLPYCSKPNVWPWNGPFLENKGQPNGQREDWPRISLVTPSFNQGQYLEETIRSVLLQGYPNLQYIVIDGGSTDNSVEIIQKYSAWIDHWVSEPDEGQSDAINKGLDVTDGEWFNWLNSDDYLLPNALHALASATREDSNIIAGKTWNMFGCDLTESYRCRLGDAYPDAYFQLGVNQPGSMLRTHMLRSVGSIDNNLSLTMDLDLWIRMLLVGGIDSLVQVDSDIAVYRYHEESKTCSGDDVFATEELAVLLELANSMMHGQFPGNLQSVADEIGVPVRSFDRQPASDASDQQVLRALASRLVFQDTLLFRGLFRHHGAVPPAMRQLGLVMEELRLELRESPFTSKQEANALVKAMEASNQFDKKSAFRVLASNPTPSNARAVIRLLMKSFAS